MVWNKHSSISEFQALSSELHLNLSLPSLIQKTEIEIENIETLILKPRNNFSQTC